MTIAPHSQTTTTTEAFDDAATAVEKHPSGHVTLTVEPGHQGHFPPSHDPNRPDLSFPFETTDTQRGGFTDEYRITSKTGYITADLALPPVPSHYHTLPAVLADPEKAIRLKQVKLVTWYENDPEDPRNWSKAYKWCKCPECSTCRDPPNKPAGQISPLYARFPLFLSRLRPLSSLGTLEAS